MAWTSVTFAYGSVLTSAKMTQVQDNFTAMADGASGSPATTRAVGTNNTSLATTAFCEAGFINNDIGAAAIGCMALMLNSSGSAVASNATVAGSNLNPVIWNSSTKSNAAAATGTWRNLSTSSCANGDSAPFQRIS